MDIAALSRIYGLGYHDGTMGRDRQLFEFDENQTAYDQGWNDGLHEMPYGLHFRVVRPNG